MSRRSLTGVAAILAPLVLFGPPRLTVSANAPGQPLTVTIEHHDGADDILVTGRVITLRNGRLVERAARVAESASSGAGKRVMQLAPPTGAGNLPSVVVVRGTHGHEGPYMEAMVELNQAGAVVGISYSKRKTVLGGTTYKPFSEADIEAALRDLSN